ncbi:hypothetical protein FGF66_04760 [Chlorobaculum thiosulfatiphilum]|uniref:Uncharacterized protein n=1 Tax=Chlorobaculum thiosulfatiphilum TaxID=115852 RepID=A0A5C4S8C6_CHLTI|nr:hypothetical protein [Chlorobaculum thiosulfatiphilum]TNJ39417.1 hypothetical protein FGF66_04760 [Chlorobaculum thiosulfatiphilum]
MDYRLAFDPSLDLAAAELASAWNDCDYAGQAVASLQPVSVSSFPMTEMTVILLSAAASIPATVIATFISDYLKQKFSGKQPPVVEVTTITTPDGEPLFIIRKSIEQQEP